MKKAGAKINKMWIAPDDGKPYVIQPDLEK
jgi:hypothetical protein